MTYSVPSRLAGHSRDQQTIEAWVVTLFSGQEKYDRKPTRYVMDYRHIIHALIRKATRIPLLPVPKRILP